MGRKKIPDPKYLGIPNICFSITDKDDDREKEFSKQRIERGFDNSETWNLNTNIAKFILPRLKEFRDTTIAYPGYLDTPEEWEEILDKMIFSFEYSLDDDYTDELHEEYKEGMKLFCDNFLALWW